jgi:RNA polymerase sigma-70 factor (ECF subfamily)
MKASRTMSALAHAGRPSKAETSDEVLMALVADGDKDAIRLLFARHNAKVFRFLTRLVGDAATAEDLVSEVFLEAWRRAARFEARSQVATWLLGIARHKALSALRRRAPEMRDDPVETIEDTADNPEVALQKRDTGAILRDCLRQLSSAHREIIDLIYYHGRTIDDAAEIIGVPHNTVKTRMFHARRRIADLIAGRGIERAWL